MTRETQKWLARVSFISKEYPFGPIAIQRNPEGLMHDKGDTPAYVSPTRVVNYRNGRRHGIDVDIWGSITYYHNGTLVPPLYVLDPQSLTFEEILSHPNTEVRRVGVEIYGFQRMIEEKKVKLIHEDKERDHHLYEVNIKEDRPMVFVQVWDSTPLPDGTYKMYFLQVPPTMKTCKQAIAWTFYKEERDYNPVIET